MLSPDMTFETRLEAAARERREKLAVLEKERAKADAKGELWTAQAALYPGRVFCVVYHGVNDDMEPLESQHRTSGVFMGPVYLTGKQSAVMAEALALFAVDEITIRVVK